MASSACVPLRLAALLAALSPAAGLLYPRASESRDVVSLDGVWQFRVSPAGDPDAGFRDSWFGRRLAATGAVMDMPVPCSFNDVTTDRRVRHYVGWAWYDRAVVVPRAWRDRRVVLRFGSVNYNAIVWVNGQPSGSHEGGHLPFELDVTSLVDLRASADNWVTVAVNNTLDLTTIPQGHVTFKTDADMYPPGYFEQSYNFEYFHYAGIHRSVQLYTTPQSVYISDVVITTNFSRSGAETTAYVSYTVDVVRSLPQLRLPGLVRVRDRLGAVVSTTGIELLPDGRQVRGMVTIPNATLWWPVGMGQPAGLLYSLELVAMAKRRGGGDADVDTYREPFGVRTVAWDKDGLYINDRPFYFRGFGKHEDANVVGRGLSLPLIVRDVNLLLWSGANSFRTSHYPYAEELMDRTDAAGIVVIDESPAIGLEGFGAALLAKHRRVMTELVARDKNRPSVVVWSLGNEPQSADAGAGDYFRAVYDHTRALDPTRAITTVVSVSHNDDQASAAMDLVCINRYFGWYSDAGRSELIPRQIELEVSRWRETFGKPVIVSEYGAGSVSGLRDLPAFIWTEDYQAEFLRQYHKGFDALRAQPWFIGEMVWNFADFEVPQEYIRPQFCSKGVFTRDRKPKLAAYVMRDRYTSMAP